MIKKIFLISLITVIFCFAVVLNTSAEVFGKLTYEIIEGEIVITNCDQSVSSIEIPAQINGATVMGIAGGAFANCTSLTAIEIPDSIKVIGKDAFYGCSRLSEVHISDLKNWCNIIFYNEYANPMYRGWGSLVVNGEYVKELKIPNGVTSIGHYAFCRFLNLEKVEIPNSVTTIGVSAFSACENLINVKIPDSVTTVGEYAFSNTGITSIEIPESLTTIPNGMFVLCDNLKSVKIPDSVTTIGNYAFSSAGLKEVEFSKNIRTIGTGAFQSTSLTAVDFPESVTTIGDEAFYNTDIISLVIPDSVKYIGAEAFKNCRSLITVKMPDNKVMVGENAFADCTEIAKVDIKNISNWFSMDFKNEYSNPLYYAGKLYVNNALLTKLNVPTGITEINDYAFVNCIGILNVNIPEGVTSIGDSAFESCTRLVSISVPDSLTNIGERAFCGCKYLPGIIIPDNVTTIGSCAFDGCSGLTGINIPESVVSIGENAFTSCEGLTRVDITDIKKWCETEFANKEANPLYCGGKLYLNNAEVKILEIPESVRSISNYAFINCQSIEELYIPDTVTNIGIEAFALCSELKNATVGRGVMVLPESIFDQCDKLKYVVLNEELLSIQYRAFAFCYELEYIFYTGDELLWEISFADNTNIDYDRITVVCNAAIRTYSFVTNCDDVVEDVTGYMVLTQPAVEKDGKVLKGWYDNSGLTGTPVSFPYCGEATTLYAAWTVSGGTSFEDAIVLKENTSVSGYVPDYEQYVYYKFIPTATKEYSFYTTGNSDTYGILYDSDHYRITRNDNGGEYDNFFISYELTAGETYYIAVCLYDGDGSFTLVSERDEDYRIDYISISDRRGNSLDVIPNGEFLATVAITNFNVESETMVVLASYADSGKLEELMYVKTKGIPADTTFELTLPVKNESGKIKKLIAYAWSSFETMMPLSEAVVFPSN